jgi:hypothetical protein
MNEIFFKHTYQIGYKICAWDVGIKNLAFCIFEMTEKGFKITKWDIVNLLEKNKLCIGVKKNKGKCTSNAKFFGTQNGKEVYYCGQHKKMHNPFPDNWENKYFSESSDCTDKCQLLLPKKKVLCDKSGKYKCGDVILCKQHYTTQRNKMMKELMLKPIKKKKCYSEGLVKLNNSMVTKLDAIPELIDVDQVYIENQPTHINPTMKSISMFLFSYYVMRGQVDNNNIKNINLVAPANKLKVGEKIDIVVDEKLKPHKGEPKKIIYAKTKFLGEVFVKHLIKTNVDWLKHLESYTKQDDLCDAFLLGFHKTFL